MFNTVIDATKEGTFGAFKVKAGRVFFGNAVVFQWFDNSIGIVAFNNRKNIIRPEDLQLYDTLLADARAAKAELIYVPSVDEFFNATARFTAFLAGNGTGAGVTLTEDELKLPTLLASVKQKFKEQLQPLPLPEPPYTLHEKTKTLSNDDKLLVSGSASSRKVRRPGGSYTIGYATAKRVALAAIKTWREYDGGSRHSPKELGQISASGYTKWPSIGPATVSIGCQTITRAQVEDLAIREGWLKV
jgi:hypothetical protein